MVRKVLMTLAAFALACAAVYGAGSLAEPSTGVARIEPGSPCPVAGCASGPEASCASTECHAWDSLSGRYHQASDASLNLWVLAPVALAVGLVALVRKAG